MSLETLAMVYYGQGDLCRGELVPGQPFSRASLPDRLWRATWSLGTDGGGVGRLGFVWHNLLVEFTPAQYQVVRPIFYLALALLLLLFSMWRSDWVGAGPFAGVVRLPRSLGGGPVGGFGAEPVAPQLCIRGTGSGLGMAEPGFRGFAYAAFCERYGTDLAPYFSVPAPVLVLLAPAVFWARRRYESTFPGMIEFVAFGVTIALVTQAPIFRTLF